MQTDRVRVEPTDDTTAVGIRLIARALDFYERRQQKYSADRNHEPASDSPATRATSPLERLIIVLPVQLDMLARDHLQTIHTILDAGLVPSWSLYSLARVTVETSARNWWILSPDDPDDRTARAVVTQLHMLRNRDLLQGGTGNAQLRISELIDAAEHAGLHINLDQKGNPTKVNGQGFTNHTDVLRKMLPTPGPQSGVPFGEFLYRLLSAASHGNDWIVLMNAQRHGDLDDDGFGLVRATGNPGHVAEVVLATVLVHATALDRWCHLHGWAKFTTQPFYKNGVTARLREALDLLTT